MGPRIVEAGPLELLAERVQGIELIDRERAEGRVQAQRLDEPARIGQQLEDATSPTLIGEEFDRVLDRGQSRGVHPAAFDAELLAQRIDLTLAATPFAVEHQQRHDHAQAQHETDDPGRSMQSGDDEGHDAEHGEHRERHRRR